jgi:hypothetical protein
MLNDIDKFTIENLVRIGGFSHKCIAGQIFGKPIDKITTKERVAISQYIYKQQLSVWTWRHGLNIEAQNAIRATVSPKRKTTHHQKRKSA